MNLQTKQKGFTIVELLIVIVVIAILAAISIVAFTGIQQRARDSERASDINNIVKALTAYTADGNDWPVDAATAKSALVGYSNINIPTTVTNKIVATAPTAATASTRYRYLPCGTAPNITGANIAYWKESRTPAAGIETVKAGSGC